MSQKEDSDRHNNSDLFYRELSDPTKEIQLTFDLGSDSAGWSAGGLQWSNDSEKIAYIAGGKPELLLVRN